MHFLTTLTTLAVTLSTANALTSSLQLVNGFNSSPTGAKMYVYVPTTKKANPAVVVAIHHCQGTAKSYFNTAPYASYADTYGFVVIYPSSPGDNGGCWDVSSTASLTHNGGGDSQTIKNMVDYAIANYGADKNRIYMSGSSSGAMMTNVLAGAYPDVFKAATLYGGVPDGCFYVSSARPNVAASWNSQCAQGQLIKTAQQWGDQTRSYYSGYSGPRPAMQMYDHAPN